MHQNYNKFSLEQEVSKKNYNDSMVKNCKHYGK